MNLAIKPYEFAPPGENELELPDDFPYQVVELGTSTELPDNSGQWTLVDSAVFAAGAAARAAIVAAAVAAHNPPPPIFYVRAQCVDADDQNALYDVLVNQNYQCEKLQG